jgi:hypothetical protein
MNMFIFVVDTKRERERIYRHLCGVLFSYVDTELKHRSTLGCNRKYEGATSQTEQPVSLNLIRQSVSTFVIIIIKFSSFLAGFGAFGPDPSGKI